MTAPISGQLVSPDHAREAGRGDERAGIDLLLLLEMVEPARVHYWLSEDGEPATTVGKTLVWR